MILKSELGPGRGYGKKSQTFGSKIKKREIHENKIFNKFSFHRKDENLMRRLFMLIHLVV